MSSIQKNLIRAALNGIVYWVDNTNGDCYTYNIPPETPTLIGKAKLNIKMAKKDPSAIHFSA